jgi:hypothetical protein
MRWHPVPVRRPLPALMTLALALAAAGCGRPPELDPKPGEPGYKGDPVPSVAGLPSPTTPPIVLPPSPSTSPGAAPSFAEDYSVACLGQPSADQIVAMLRAKTKLLPATGVITATTGPLCSGTWQYSILAIPGKEPMHVVTQGLPNALKLVTAGSDVCTIYVRTHAPRGIVDAAHC